MDIKFLTCSGANETTDIPSLLALAEKYPIAEFGVQVSEKKCDYGSRRFKWINDLALYAEQQHILLNVALHVNGFWAEECGQGRIPEALGDLFDLKDCNGDYFAKRIQFDFKIGCEKEPDIKGLTSLIENLSPQRCILSYNDSNHKLISQLYLQGVVFDCLYDDSSSEGIVPKHRDAPPFTEILQGYAGGISAENVSQTLDDIYTNWLSSPNTAGIYLDAEDCLKGEDGHLNINKCRAYLRKALLWHYEHRMYF